MEFSLGGACSRQGAKPPAGPQKFDLLFVSVLRIEKNTKSCSPKMFNFEPCSCKTSLGASCSGPEFSWSSRLENLKPQWHIFSGQILRSKLQEQIFEISSFFRCHSPNTRSALKTKFSPGDYDIAIRKKINSSLQANWNEFQTRRGRKILNYSSFPYCELKKNTKSCLQKLFNFEPCSCKKSLDATFSGHRIFPDLSLSHSKV